MSSSIDIRQRFWAAACAIEAEVLSRSDAINDPPKEMEIRFNGGVAPDVARHYSAILTSGPLPDNAQILDMGCGFGRIARALGNRLGPEARYFGLDPNAEGIAWAQRNITPLYPNFSFQRVDIRSSPYNPDGVLTGSKFRFPYEDSSLDLVFMISVLTHVDLATVENYLREAFRTLRPDGRLVATMFLLDDEVDRLLSSGQGHFRMATRHGDSRVEDPANPELAIAHPRDAILEILSTAGFSEASIFNGFWSGREAATQMDFQDLIIASPMSGELLYPAQPTMAPQSEIGLTEQNLYDRVAMLTGGEENRVGQFISWSASLALNTLWWYSDNIVLAATDTELGRTDPIILQFDALRELHLDRLRPEGSDTFHALNDDAIIRLIMKTSGTVTRHTIFAGMLEIANIGIQVLDATAMQKALVLLAPGCEPVAAPVPHFEA